MAPFRKEKLISPLFLKLFSSDIDCEITLKLIHTRKTSEKLCLKLTNLPGKIFKRLNVPVNVRVTNEANKLGLNLS